MKTKALLIGSILLNLVLAAAYWRKPSPAPAASAGPSPTAGSLSVPTSAPPKRTGVLAASTNAAPARFDWRTVESSDYRQYISNLRAIGCPPETIRDIIRADVDKLFQARARADRSPTNRFEYWRSGNPLANMFTEESVAKQQELTKEKRALLKELLGQDSSDQPDFASMYNPLESVLDFLPSDKQTRMLEIEQKFAARLMKTVKDASRGDLTEMRKVQAEKDAEMLQHLSPEEKFEYDLRLSQSAAVLRMQLGDFQPTEEEFRAMFKLQKQFDDEFGLRGLAATSKEDQARRTAAQNELDSQFKDILGADHYREYKYEQTWGRSSLRQVAQEFNVSKENALKVFEITDAATTQADEVRANAAWSDAQKQSALDGIRKAAEEEVAKAIGPDAAKAYGQRGNRLSNLGRLKRTGQQGTD